VAALAFETPVAVVGAGAMGSGIAQVAALAGHPVLLFDSVDGTAAAGKELIAKSLARAVERGRLDDDSRNKAIDR
jgi:3-hydroxybutyryl-CoA dehydrogenase